MMLQRGFTVDLLFGYLLLSSASIVCGATTFLKWTFDTHDGMTVAPEHNVEDNFKADLSPLGSDIDSILVPGIKNRSVYINGTSFNLATGLGSTCIRDIDVCGSVWGFSFWLKLVDWNMKSNPVIFRTTNVDRTEPGIYVGEGSGDEILMYLRGSSGTALWRSFKQELVWNQWGYVFVTVVGQKFLSITVNSTAQSGKTVRETVGSQPVTPANFVVGAENGPTFYLDDLTIRFSDNLIASTTMSSTTTASITTPVLIASTTMSSTTTSSATTQLSTTSPTTPSTTSTTAETTRLVTMAGSTTTSSVPGNKTPQNLSNIWIPIIIALLLALVVTGCFLWFLCSRRRKRSRMGDLENHDGTALSGMNNGYARPSAVEPYRDEESNADTDDNHTDREDNRGPLL